MARLLPRKRQSLVWRYSLQAAKEISNQSIVGTHGRRGRSMGKPHFIKGNAMGDERGQSRRGLGGINNAHFQAIVVTLAGCCCTSHRCSRRPITNGCVQDNRERVVVIPIKGGGPGRRPGCPKQTRRQQRCTLSSNRCRTRWLSLRQLSSQLLSNCQWTHPGQWGEGGCCS
jgi:hypothetical protein